MWNMESWGFPDVVSVPGPECGADVLQGPETQA